MGECSIQKSAAVGLIGFSEIRRYAYKVAAKILVLQSQAAAISSIPSLELMIQRCCTDALPQYFADSSPQATSFPSQKSGGNDHKVDNSKNADAYLGHVSEKHSVSSRSSQDTATLHDLREAAWNLLPFFLSHLQPDYLRMSWRAQIDSTAILMGHKTAMMASVLNPPRGKSTGRVVASIMPHLARAYASHLEVEGLIRPRMPLVMTQAIEDSADVQSEIGTAGDDYMDSEAMNRGTTDANIGNSLDKAADSFQEANLNTDFQRVDSHVASQTGKGSSRSRPTDQRQHTERLTEFSPHQSSTGPSRLEVDHHKAVEAEGGQFHQSSISETDKHTSKRPRLASPPSNPPTSGLPTLEQTIVPAQAPSIFTTTTALDQSLQAAGATARESLEKRNTQDDSDTDGSFEIPELVVNGDTEDEGDSDDDEDEDDEGGGMDAETIG